MMGRRYHLLPVCYAAVVFSVLLVLCSELEATPVPNFIGELGDLQTWSLDSSIRVRRSRIVRGNTDEDEEVHDGVDEDEEYDYDEDEETNDNDGTDKGEENDYDEDEVNDQDEDGENGQDEDEETDESGGTDEETDDEVIIVSTAAPHMIEDDGDAVVSVLGSMGGFCCLVGLGYVIGTCRQRRKYRESLKSMTALPSFAGISEDVRARLFANGTVEPKTPLELDRNGINLLDVIGSGQYGEVRLALLSSHHASSANLEEVHVAVKILKQSANREDWTGLMEEAAITAMFDHPNIVKLIGVVSEGNPKLIVVQYCSGGSLHSRLSRLWPDIPDHVTLYKYALGIARGLEYMSSMGFVHRDIATRNILLNAADVPKVADFGLSRKTSESQEEEPGYYRVAHNNIQLPIAWLAPETLMDSKFTEFSDCWAYGITLIELFSGANPPYGDWIPLDIMFKVKEGYVLPRPEKCSVDFFENVIAPCLEFSPELRPRFNSLVKIISYKEQQLLGSTDSDSVSPPLTAESTHYRISREVVETDVDSVAKGPGFYAVGPTLVDALDTQDMNMEVTRAVAGDGYSSPEYATDTHIRDWARDRPSTLEGPSWQDLDSAGATRSEDHCALPTVDGYDSFCDQPGVARDRISPQFYQPAETSPRGVAHRSSATDFFSLQSDESETDTHSRRTSLV